MLKQIQIKGLYRLYDYDIMLHRNGEDPLFITGPNGYGKTTILNIINWLYSMQFDDLCNLEFETITTIYEVRTFVGVSEMQLQINRVANSDNSGLFHLEMWIENTKSHNNLEMISYPNEKSFSFSVLFNSNDLYYIRDQRLTRKITYLEPQEEPTVVSDSKHFYKTLKSLSDNFKNALQVSDLEFSNTISKLEYDSSITKLDSEYEPLYRYGLLEKKEHPIYSEHNAIFLKAYVDLRKSVIEKYRNDVELIKTFEEIINSYIFADKEMKIEMDNFNELGFWFKSTNDLKTPLENSKLSSGERHILILFYELLFSAQQNAFVLIDEPELSAHYAWQQLFLENIRRVIKLKNLQCVVATHSPLVFNGKYEELTVDLYDQISGE